MAQVTQEQLLSRPYAELSAAFGFPVGKVVTESVVGGLSNKLLRLTAHGQDGQRRTLVLKQMPEGSLATSKALGLAREAMFYNILASKLRNTLPVHAIPDCPWAQGDMETGAKMMLLEDVSGALDSGLCFGMGTPLNWARAEAVSKASTVASAEDCAASAFQLAARMHARFWRDQTLLQYEWLRGTDWYSGKGKAAFEASQAHAANAWAATRKDDRYPVQWPPLLLACMDASIGKASWDKYQEQVQARPWTLAHGDFHPGNMLLMPSPPSTDPSTATATSSNGVAPAAARPVLMMLDYEVVGLGSGPQDLGQYVVSHMEPSVRRACERRLLESYHASLGPSITSIDLPWDDCWAEYVAGGSERWVWLLAVLTQMAPPKAVQYWADQLHAFMADHGVTPETIGMPRV